MTEDRKSVNLREALTDIARSGKIAQAYILESPDDAGLLAAAKDFAKRIGASAADTVFVEREKPNLLSVSDVRDGIVASVAIRPYDSPYKVYIVEQADDMNVQAQNALLKTLEEPPEYVVILLLVKNAKLFLPTILSRCVKLTDTNSAEDPERGEEAEAVQLTDRFFREAASMTSERELYYAAEFAKIKQDSDLFLERFLEWYRDILVVKSGGESSVPADRAGAARTLAEKMPYEKINRCVERVLETRQRLEANVNTEMSLEMLVLEQRKAMTA